MENIPFLANNSGPPWLPASVAEARRFAYWGQLLYFIFGLILLILGILSVIFVSWVSGIYLCVSGIVDLIIVFLLKTTVFDTIDQGRFNEASDRLLIWGILGIIFGIIPGILMIIAFLRIQDVFQPQYQQPPATPGQQQYQQPPATPGQQQYGPPQQQVPQQPPQPVQQYQQPPATPGPQQYGPPQQQVPQQPPQPQEKAKPKHEMVKCKKCGVQYPAFMRTCPNCGEPR